LKISQAAGIFNNIFVNFYLFPHKFVTILAIVKTSAVEANLENFRHHFSQHIEIERLLEYFSFERWSQFATTSDFSSAES